MTHDHATLVLYLGGQAHFWMHRAYEPRAGDVIAIPAGAPHYFLQAHDLHLMGLSLCTACAQFAGKERLQALLERVAQGGNALYTLAAFDAFRRDLERLRGRA